MAASKLDLIIELGATFTKQLVWKSGIALTPVDLTGCSARMQLRETIDSPQVVLELSTANGYIALGGTSGTISLSIPASVTATISSDKSVYDLEITFPDTTVSKLVYGTVQFIQQVTR